MNKAQISGSGLQIPGMFMSFSTSQLHDWPCLPTNIGQGSRRKFSLGQRSIQAPFPLTSSRHWMVTVIKNAPTQALAPRFCAMGLNFYSPPADFHSGTWRGGNANLLKRKLITMKYFCGKLRVSSAPPHNLRSKDTPTPPGVPRLVCWDLPSILGRGDVCVCWG